MFAFNDILQKIEQEITRLQFTYPPKSLYEPIEYILSLGGKRIRPALVLMACNLYKENVDTAIKPALGLEVFHNFTLLHDDLMDEADKRRNKPTVHKVWNANTAILSGDAMLIAAYQLIGETKSESLKEILDLFTRTALEICGGQQYDMEFESRNRRNGSGIHRNDPSENGRIACLRPEDGSHYGECTGSGCRSVVPIRHQHRTGLPVAG